MQRNRSLWCSAAAAACTLTLLACGSSNQPDSASAKSNLALKLAQCMRAHGVPNFPDPGPGGGLDITPASGVDLRSPAFHNAQQACKRYFPSFPAPGTMSASQRRSAVAFAECMRTHGEPDFPDPTIGRATRATTGHVLALRGMFFAIGAGVDPKAPAFRQAAARCGLNMR